MVQDHFWENLFLTHFRHIFAPKTAHFQGILVFIFHAPKRVTTGSKRTKNTCLNITNDIGSLLENAFLTHL